MNQKADPQDGPDRGSHEPPLPTRHHLHREGGYLGIDADVRLDYGDGTPEWLADRLRRPPEDPWQPPRSSWLAERNSWAPPRDPGQGGNPSDEGDSDDPSRPGEHR